MNESNARTLREFAAWVRQVRGTTPEETRSALLDRGKNGESIVDTFRRAQVRPAGEPWGSPFTPEELLGAAADPPTGLR